MLRSNQLIGRSVLVVSVALCLLQSAMHTTEAYSVNGSLLIGPQHITGKYVKYSIDDLMNGQFEYKVSDDIDMDPCKSSRYIRESYAATFVYASVNRVRLSQIPHMQLSI